MSAEGTFHAITQLMANYAHAIDDDRLEEWPDFFTADGTYAIMPRDSEKKGYAVGIMNCMSPGMMRDRVLAYRKANVYEPHSYRHTLSAMHVIDVKNDEAHTETAYSLFRIQQDGSTSIFSTGKYVDVIRLGTEPLLFKSRKIICDSSRIDTLIVIPI